MAKYYYNGVLLPEIPADVLAEYPYCAIRLDSDGVNYRLLMSNAKWFYLTTNKCIQTNGSQHGVFLTTSTSDEWEFNSWVSTVGNWGKGSDYVWFSHDVPQNSATSTTIYFYGSDPVPETPLVDKKYLIRSSSTIYTITDGTLTALAETEITASLFQTYGVDEIPDGSLLVGLTDPEVLYWQDSEDELPVLELTVSGTPPVPQVVVTDAQDMSDGTILGIESVSIEASADVLWALSFDDGTSWKAYDGTQWVTLEQENSGMTAETFQNIPLEAWAEIVTSDAYRVRFVLMDTTSYVTSLVIHYLN